MLFAITNKITFKPEYVIDNNIFEQTDFPQKNENIQLWTTLKLAQKNKHCSTVINNTNNLSIHKNYNFENKIYNSLQVKNFIPISKKVYLNSSGLLFTKNYLTSVSGYYDAKITENIGYNFNKINLAAGLLLHQNKFINNHKFNSGGLGQNLLFSYRKNRKFSFHISLNNSGIKFQHKQYIWSSDRKYIYIRRKDNIQSVMFGCEYKNRFISGVQLVYSNCTSNIENYTNSTYFLKSYVTKYFNKTLIQLILNLRYKSYDFDSASIVSSDSPDPERNSCNQFFLGIEHPVTKKIFITGKFALMQNESIILGQYYNKTIFAFGFLFKVN